MPQVNEVSWFSLSFSFMVLSAVLLIKFNPLVCKGSPLNPIVFKLFFESIR